MYGEGKGTPLQYSCLENPMDRGAWSAAVHGVTKSWIRLRDFTFTFHFHALEKEMATHSSVLAWRIPGTGEPGGLPCIGSHRVGHDWSDSAAAAVYMYSAYPSFPVCPTPHPSRFTWKRSEKSTLFWAAEINTLKYAMTKAYPSGETYITRALSDLEEGQLNNCSRL